MAVLQIVQANNLKFNPDKCIFHATEVSYFGHLLSSQGLKPDPNKVPCIEDFPLQQVEQTTKFPRPYELHVKI